MNLAIFYLNGKFVDKNEKLGRALVLSALFMKNPKAVECIVQFGLKSRQELKELIEAINFNRDEAFRQQVNEQGETIT